MSLKTDYKDDIYEGSRRYRITPNEDGTSTITDATTYTQKGDKFGQNDINAINVEINKMQRTIVVTLPAAGWSAAAPYTQRVAVPGSWRPTTRSYTRTHRRTGCGRVEAAAEIHGDDYGWGY